MNMQKWLLFNSVSICYLIGNKKLVNNVRPAESQGVISNSGQLDINHEADMDGVGTVPFSEDSIANLVSMAELINSGYRIFVDTAIEDTIFVFCKNKILKFERSEKDLYFYNTENRQISFLNNQYENSFNYTKR